MRLIDADKLVATLDDLILIAENCSHDLRNPSPGWQPNLVKADLWEREAKAYSDLRRHIRTMPTVSGSL